MEMSIERGLLLWLSSPSNNTQVLNEYQKCQGKPTGVLFWSVFCLFSVFLGIPASVMVLMELCRRRQQWIFNDVFMFNLSIMDLIFTASLLPSVCNYLLLGNKNISYFASFVHGLPLCGRPLLMACICGDCYFAVIHPIIYMTNKNGTRIRQVTCLAVWMITFGFGSALTALKDIFTTPLISAPLMVALPVITFCDVSVFQALKSPDPSGKTSIHPKKKRALQTICTSFIMTFTAYLPPAIMFMFARVLLNENFYCTFTFYGISFCVAGCVIMPVLYLDSVGKMDRLKKRLKNVFRVD